MKRTLGLTLFGALVAILGGCPIYSGDSGDYRVCDGNQCYECPANVYSSACAPWQCSTSLDCPGGYVCGGDGTCVNPNSEADGGVVTVDASTSCTPGSCESGYTCGADNNCDPGNCTTTGCPTGWACVLENGAAVCAEDVSATDSGTTTITPDAAFPLDASAADAGAVACQTDPDCAIDGGNGGRCLDGTCVAPVNQCYAGSQCPTGDECVQGACTPTCSATVACPTGYSCDANGTCTGDPTPCASNPSVCAAGTVCSQNHCVPSCGGGVTCPANEQCLQGGCVPNEQPLFTCTTDGVQDACAVGSICLHHSCYIACNADAANACQSADQLNECKPVTTASGTYDVCGSSTDLGSQCSPTLACPSAGVCIDGYCH
jgi:hypothetical protein